jgi:hypothetical protein
VENQTEVTAPASPVAPVAYIVAGSGGAWSGYSVGDLAICNVDGSWTRSVPAIGDEVFDKALNVKYRWNGTAWQSAAGAVIEYDSADIVNITSSATTGSAFYIYSTTSPPGDVRRGFDSKIWTITSRRIGQLIEFEWSADTVNTSGNANAGSNQSGFVFALYRDDETLAIDHSQIELGTVNFIQGAKVQFRIEATDVGIAHTYKAAFISFRRSDVERRWHNTANAATRRRFSYKMYA